jgi:hypothetical protein
MDKSRLATLPSNLAGTGLTTAVGGIGETDAKS